MKVWHLSVRGPGYFTFDALQKNINQYEHVTTCTCGRPQKTVQDAWPIFAELLNQLTNYVINITMTTNYIITRHYYNEY